VAITSGLSSGQIVVVDGGDRLRDGSRVLLPQAGAADAAGTTAAPPTHRGRGAGAAPSS
jgi:multidrug efflux system membrane fusion protein